VEDLRQNKKSRAWWIMMRELGSERRFPFAPAPRRKAPIEAAVPKQTVATSQGTYLDGARE